ncbi:hypothetical protein M885DRAFT_513000 [Pelagophyceae sp. CCMP2097]|nr:hypothetical protein M885DRAFT_513000 [Pelagophyceae sp. CCMP2097]|mmetsp:Transcript_15432/g.54949  ORF Transcript_15432/g.54949 Transcript_15432/m.54949 type:complete len:206 (+) Transcript_15432:84-701(+)
MDASAADAAVAAGTAGAPAAAAAPVVTPFVKKEDEAGASAGAAAPSKAAKTDGVDAARERQLQRLAPPTMLRAGAQAHASMISSVREQLQASVVSDSSCDRGASYASGKAPREALSVLALGDGGGGDGDLLAGPILQTPHMVGAPDTPLTRLLPALEQYDEPLYSPMDFCGEARPIAVDGETNWPRPEPARKRPRPAHFTFDSVA